MSQNLFRETMVFRMTSLLLIHALVPDAVAAGSGDVVFPVDAFVANGDHFFGLVVRVGQGMGVGHGNVGQGRTGEFDGVVFFLCAGL